MKLSWSQPHCLYVCQKYFLHHWRAIFGAPFGIGIEMYVFLCRDGKIDGSYDFEEFDVIEVVR